MHTSQPTTLTKYPIGMREPRAFGVEDRPPCPSCGAERRSAVARRGSLLASCKACAHETVLNVEALADSVPLSWFATRFVCRCCNAVGAHILPCWTDEPGPRRRLRDTDGRILLG